MSAKHTPGPWYANSVRVIGDAKGCDIGAANGANVALVHYDPLDAEPPEVKANARLIAAAPDMLAALKEASDGLRYWQPQTTRGVSECNRITTMVHAAIAKAEGRDP